MTQFNFFCRNKNHTRPNLTLRADYCYQSTLLKLHYSGLNSTMQHYRVDLMWSSSKDSGEACNFVELNSPNWVKSNQRCLRSHFVVFGHAMMFNTFLFNVFCLCITAGTHTEGPRAVHWVALASHYCEI